MMVPQQVTDHAANTAVGIAAGSAVVGTALQGINPYLQAIAYIASAVSATIAGIYHYKKIRGK